MGLLDRAEKRIRAAEAYGARIIDAESIDWSRYELSETEQARVREASSWETDLVDAFSNPGNTYGSTLPWETVGDKLRIRPAELSVWSGYNGSGKSLAIGQIMLGLTSQSDRVCIASLEMRPIQTLKRMVRQHSQCATPSPSDVRGFTASVTGKLWVYEQVGTIKSERMLALCRYAREEIGCSHMVIDSLMKCGVGVDDYNAQKAFIDKLSTYAKDSDLHIHLVAHSRKGQDESLQGKMDVKGSSEITDMADNVFVWWLNKKKYFARQEGDAYDESDPDAVMVCEKQRNGEWMGKVGLWFDEASLSYTDVRPAYAAKPFSQRKM
jgi:twinkle protein